MTSGNELPLSFSIVRTDWSYDFVAARTRDGRPPRMLNLIDEFTRECLSIDVARRLDSDDVLERLTDLFVSRSVPDHVRSDNAPGTAAYFVQSAHGHAHKIEHSLDGLHWLPYGGHDDVRVQSPRADDTAIHTRYLRLTFFRGIPGL